MGFSLRQAITFIVVFLITMIVDFILFAGIITSLGEKTSWIMDNPVLSISGFFLVFAAIPGIAANYITFYLNKEQEDLSLEGDSQKKRLKYVFSFTIAMFFILMAIPMLMPSKFDPYTLVEIDEKTEFTNITSTPTIAAPTGSLGSIPNTKISPTLTYTAQPTITSAPLPTSTPIPTSTPMPTSTPTPTPRIPNPPVMDITYPSEMQSIEFTSASQTFCAVEVPAGGDTSGLQRKHSINDGSWSSYTDIFTLCFSPVEGLNRFQVQYRNKYGEESTMYTRQFNFHKAY